MTKRHVRRVLVVVAAMVATAGLLVTLRVGAASAFDATRSMCYQVSVAGAGYGPRICNGDPAGPTNSSQHTDALSLVQSGAGQLCVSVYLNNFGQQGQRCAGGSTPFEVGLPGQGYDISGMQWTNTTGRLCVRFYAIFDSGDQGWYGPTCNNGGFDIGSFGVRGRIGAVAMYFD